MNTSRYMEERVLSADPIELIHIVYQHALDMVGDARKHLAAGDIAARSRSISRTIDAIAELEGSLNGAQGGQIGTNLGELYQYMRSRLTIANLQQVDAPLAEVESLLGTLAEAWSELRTAEASPAPEIPEPSQSPVMNWNGAMFPEPQVELAHSWSA